MQANLKLCPSQYQPPRPRNPRDTREREAAEVLDDLLDAGRRGIPDRVRHHRGRLVALGYDVEPLDVGCRLVALATGGAR